MGANTMIEWATHTFNPWVGCTKVGPGCDHCYAEGWAKRSGSVQWGPHAARRRTSATAGRSTATSDVAMPQSDESERRLPAVCSTVSSTTDIRRACGVSA